MESGVAERASGPAEAQDRAARNLDQECQDWDWARTAGVSAQELRRTLREALGG